MGVWLPKIIVSAVKKQLLSIIFIAVTVCFLQVFYRTVGRWVPLTDKIVGKTWFLWKTASMGAKYHFQVSTHKTASMGAKYHFQVSTYKTASMVAKYYFQVSTYKTVSMGAKYHLQVNTHKLSPWVLSTTSR